jgi:hypothetical protein
MRVPEGIEKVIGTPVQEEGHDGASDEDEGEENSADFRTIHRVTSRH